MAAEQPEDRHAEDSAVEGYNPKVLVGAPCGKKANYDEFYDCFYGLDGPTELMPRMRARGGDISTNLNKLVEQAMTLNCTHLFVVEDDSAFLPDTLMRLLAHDVPVVTGLCRARHAPFRPYIYKGMNETTGLAFYSLQPTDKGLIGGHGWATGMGGILIQMNVFDKLQKPYFDRYTADDGRVFGQDIDFGMKLIRAGVPVYCDLDVVIYHNTDCLIGSAQAPDGRWLMTLRVDQSTMAFDTEKLMEKAHGD
jgi:hypothetical protein